MYITELSEWHPRPMARKYHGLVPLSIELKFHLSDRQLVEELNW